MLIVNKVTEIDISRGFAESRAITKKHAKSFYFASQFLPKEKRYAAYAVYAICRISDHSVDNPSLSSSPLDLEEIQNKIIAAYGEDPLDDKVLLAFRQTVKKYKIPRQYFDELIEGMYMDLDKSRYDNFKELYQYCYKVAGVVGLIMLTIFGHEHPKTKIYAIRLGIAMQLTNILRDIKEDFQMGRIYLPKDEMERFGITEQMIKQGRISKRFRHFLKFQIRRAKEYYHNSTRGIKMIGNMESRLVVCMMRDIYSGILGAIEKNRYDVFSRRAYVRTFTKILIACKLFSRRSHL